MTMATGPNQRYGRLSAEDYEEVVKDLKITDRNKEITRGVLVDGDDQKSWAQKYKLSPGSISRIVHNIWHRHLLLKNPHLVEMTVILPKYKAHLVRQWSVKLD